MRLSSPAITRGAPRRALLPLVLALGASGALALPQTPATTASAARPHPFIADHLTKEGLTFPPDTAYCRAAYGTPCYQPAQFQKAYDMQPLYNEGLTGRGRTIVIVDAFGSPTITQDLAQFDKTFGLPDPPSLQVITPVGAPPPFDPNDPEMVGWAEETSLDVEYAHAMAPGANILLVETPVSETEGVTGFPEIVAAENYVIDHNLGDVISQSFGATEETFPKPTAVLGLRSAFYNAERHGVSVLASSGDQGATDLKSDLSCCYPYRVTSWPSTDPLVTSVGGTLLNLDAAGNRLSPDVAANDGPNGIASGGGLSRIFPRPPYQSAVKNVVGDHRGTPDISMSGACAGYAVVYWSWPQGVTSPGYHRICGTSESSPLFSGVVAIADQIAHRRLGLLNPRIYQLYRQGGANGIIDVTQGDNSWTFCSASCGTPSEVDTTVAGYPARPGYDLVTGVGTIDGNVFARRLAREQVDERAE